jgi:hypothetical protein
LTNLVREFHSSLHKDDFTQLQLDCSALWKGRLSFSGLLVAPGGDDLEGGRVVR